MLKINKLTLENFQSHKFSVIDFDQGLNAIVGPTDSGKTAILRAIKWALYNEPQGDFFIRKGETNISVKVEFSNGNIIHRYRTKSKNGYEIIYSDGKISSFEGFGTKVPVEVFEVSQMPKINLGQNESKSLNMAEQLDGPFLLSDTSSLKAAAIGKLVEADVVDFALGQVNLDLKNIKKEARFIDENLLEVDNQLKEYDYLIDLRKTINKLEEYKDELDKKTVLLEKLENIYIKYRELIKNKTIINNILYSLQNLNYVDDSLQKAFEKVAYLQKLTKMQRGYLNNRNRLKDIKTQIYNFEQIATVEKDYNKILGKNNLLKNLERIFGNRKILLKNKAIAINLSKSLINVEASENIYEKSLALEKKLDKYIASSEELKKALTRQKNGEKYLEKFSNLSKAGDNYDKLLEKIGFYNKMKLTYKRYGLLINNIQIEEENINISEKEIEKIEVSYKNLIKEMKVCPTCKRPFDLENPDIVIKHLSE